MLPASDPRLWLWIGAVFYGLAFAYTLIQLLRERPQGRLFFYALLIGGFLFQSIGLYLRGLSTGVVPLSNPMEILQVIAWTIIFMDLVIRAVFRLKLLGFFSCGLAALLGLLALAVPGWDGSVRGSGLLNNPWVEFHALLAIFSYGVFALLAIVALMYLLQHYGLTHKRSRGLFMFLPAIRQLDIVGGRLLALGVCALTLSVAIGTLKWLISPEALGAIKLLVALAVWLAYLILLIVRTRRWLMAQSFAWLALGLFAVAMLSLWPLNREPVEEERPMASSPLR